MDRKREKRPFGQITKLPSGRYRARYVRLDGNRHSAPSTFEDKDTAVLWLKNERALTEDADKWEPRRRGC